jgi:2-hydroxy-6-oxonona-2,4-dienedioate hydrolase
MTEPLKNPQLQQLEITCSLATTPIGEQHGEMTWRCWGSGPDLVLLHGGAGSWMHWARNIEFLARIHRVWVPDLPGFGDSDLPPGVVDADVIAPIVLDGIRRLMQGAPFDLIGFSFGGLVAALIGAQNPEELRKIILVSVTAMGLLNKPITMKSMRGITTAAEKAEVLKHNLNALMIHDPSAIDDLALEIHDRNAIRERAKSRTLVRTDILFALSRQWRMPVYGIWSLNDALYIHQPDQLKQAVGSLGLDDYRLLPKGGHWVQFEEVDDFHRIVDEFLSRPSGREEKERKHYG